MTWVFILRLVVAGLLGTVVGIEREWRVKEAGFRTHFLVSLGSALFMIISQWGFEEFLAGRCQKGDMLITMGAGNVVNIGEDLLKD